MLRNHRRPDRGEGPWLRPLRLTLALTASLVLVACGTTTPTDPTPDPPVITSVAPATVAAGDTVTITGSNLASGATVTLTSARSTYLVTTVTVASAGTSATFTMPSIVEPEERLSLDVTLRQGTATATRDDALEYVVSLEALFPDGAVFDFSGVALADPDLDFIDQPWIQTVVTVQESEWATNGRALVIEPYTFDPADADPSAGLYADGAFHAVTFVDVGPFSVVDVVARLRNREPENVSGDHWMGGIGARLAGAAGSEQGFLGQTKEGTNGLVAARIAYDGTQAAIPDFLDMAEFPVASGEYLRFRLTMEEPEGIGTIYVVELKTGSTLAAVYGDVAWDARFEIDTNLPAGAVGITRFFDEHTTEVDWIAITELGL
jgi:hypothetical protein